MSDVRQICLLGFGEVGQILATDLMARGYSISAWDVAVPMPGGQIENIRRGISAIESVTGADLVISAVTADRTFSAAQSIVDGLSPGTWFMDMNSASPQTKKEAAATIAKAGGHYVEAAVMSPVPIRRLATSILLGGPDAEGFEPIAHALGFTEAKTFSPILGKASAAKMCRSIMVKGIEALITESMLTARQNGVEETVLTSLNDLFPGPDWPALSYYMISRSIEHGIRRAEEMKEVALTVTEAGLSPFMSEATVKRHQLAPAFLDELR
ncbi:MAG: DUF1932 domain-containing protein, partial [Pseudomonadota bacterium]